MSSTFGDCDGDGVAISGRASVFDHYYGHRVGDCGQLHIVVNLL